MAQSLTVKEKFLTLNGLVCLAQGLEGKYTTIDLRNETYVTGKIINVDGYMNVNMEDVIYTNAMGGQYLFDNFFIQARNIRYVHIPDQMPIIRTIETQLKKVMGSNKPNTSAGKRTFKQKRAEVQQKETLKIIGEIKSSRLTEKK